MLIKILFTDFPPSISIALSGIWIALMTFVVSCSSLPVFLAVAPISEAGAAWMRTWSLWFVGHRLFSFVHKKSPGGFPELFGFTFLMVG
jgi:hypothetical protein